MPVQYVIRKVGPNEFEGTIHVRTPDSSMVSGTARGASRAEAVNKAATMATLATQAPGLAAAVTPQAKEKLAAVRVLSTAARNPALKSALLESAGMAAEQAAGLVPGGTLVLGAAKALLRSPLGRKLFKAFGG